MIKALILDLDNTIYPVSSIGNELFEPLQQLLNEHKAEVAEDVMREIKKQIMRRAWQKVADENRLSPELIKKGNELLSNLTYDKPMNTFADYEHVRQLPLAKFLVTMGFTNMQNSKVKQLNIGDDFTEIHINDPELSKDTKKEVFQDILLKHALKPHEVLVIGDDPESEIKAALQLGIPTVLYDRNSDYSNKVADHHINNFAALQSIIDSYGN
ncbi:HAD family hydrolase [Mucilaginibacter terrae]|uniref:Hydrolase of the HAD superfamily n=1 Tax=Mucilaginibacter terrae TaxID=1955052 RepID=A0ABU3H0E9_9SPHI|nr:HAD family hydrolase [Mucilaginibacter terrae]MDT3405494.1 putative hydrolase of the HAD superfamily [Mucilaginibacter terrae]